MPIEMMLIFLVVAAIVAISCVVAFANGDKAPVAVPVKTLNDAPAPKKEFTAVQPSTTPNADERRIFLEKKLAHVEAQLADSQEILQANDALRFDNIALKKELMEVMEKYRAILAQTDVLKEQSESQVARLIKEKEILAEKINSNDASQAQQLLQEVEDLRRTQDKLKELNQTLSTKTDMLQYELIKSRAQATGHERIASNYRQRLEELTGQAQGINAEYSQMPQHNNRLETEPSV